MARRIVQFRNYQVNLDAKELFKEGIRVKLEAQPFQVLEALLERPGEIVSREELQKKLWAADTFVDFERGLNTAIRKIRDSLCDEAAAPRFVETVPRRGYRFIAPLTDNGETEAPPPPSKRRDWRIPAAAAAVIAMAGAAGGIVWMKQRPSGPRQYRVTQLTRDIGVTHHPGISGDGHLVVYASDRATGQDSDIWIQHVRGGSPTRRAEVVFRAGGGHRCRRPSQGRDAHRGIACAAEPPWRHDAGAICG